MKKALLPLFLSASLIGCLNPEDNLSEASIPDHKQTLAATIRIITQYYDDGSCELDLVTSWEGKLIRNVEAEYCKEINVGDKVLVIDVYKNKSRKTKIKKLSSGNSKPNLP